LVIATAAPLTLAQASPATFVALEDHLSEALAAYDAATVGELWDDAFVFVNPEGRVAGKAQRLAGIGRPGANAGPALTSHNDSVDVRYEDARMAVVLVRSTWRQGDKQMRQPYLATHVWVKRGDAWKLLSAQVAQIAP
jgi:ketosteroid isomerase-like protein